MRKSPVAFWSPARLVCWIRPASVRQRAPPPNRVQRQERGIELVLSCASSFSTHVAEKQSRCSPASLFPIRRFPEAQVHPDVGIKIAVHLGVERRPDAFEFKAWSAPDMEMGVSRSLAIVHHQEFHLPHGQFFKWSSRARVSLMSLSLPVPVSVYLVVKIPVRRTDRLRRLVAIRDDAFKNHCAVCSSETFIIIFVPGADDTSSANAWLTRCNCGMLWNEKRNETSAPRAVCSTWVNPG